MPRAGTAWQFSTHKCAKCWNWWEPEKVAAAALAEFPDRTLRRVPDPHISTQFWTWENGIPKLYLGEGFADACNAPITPERWAIWRDLEANPWETK